MGLEAEARVELAAGNEKLDGVAQGVVQVGAARALGIRKLSR